MNQFLPGTIVRARGLSWEVVHSQPAGEHTLCRLRCLAQDLNLDEMDVLAPLEDITLERQPFQHDRAAPLHQFRVYHQAFLLDQALGASTIAAAQPGRLRIAPYQLVPVLRALQMGRARLLIADAVGLGKTVEAGLVLAELLARRRAHRVLIVSPAGPLLDQWRGEMRDRFGLRFAVLDTDGLQEIRRSQELGANPFDYEALGLISMDTAKQEKVLVELEKSAFDLVIIDEAHHYASLGSSGEREDSQRRKLAEVLARKADHLLLLTATPHDGDDQHFGSILGLLDPSLVDGHGLPRGESYRKHIVRRLKRHIVDELGNPLFLDRVVCPREVVFDEASFGAFTRFQRALLALVAPRLRAALKKRRYGEVLAFIALLKRSVSTARACRFTLAAIHTRISSLLEKGQEQQEERRQRLRSLREYQRRLARQGSLSAEEEQEKATLEAEDMAAELLFQSGDTPAEEVRTLHNEAERGRRRAAQQKDLQGELSAVHDLAAEAEKRDPKLLCIAAEIIAIRREEPHANVIVYTEYVDSQAAIVEHLRSVIDTGKIGGELLAISGSGSDEVDSALSPAAPAPRATRAAPAKPPVEAGLGGRYRARALKAARFMSEDNLILVSTDATAEGLNLHQHCHHLIHAELPYNPNRLEQRNGRIDRFGQKLAPTVRYLYLKDTFEERILLRLVEKYEKQRERLTFVPDTLGVAASSEGGQQRLLEGFQQEDSLFLSANKPITLTGALPEDTAAPAYQEILAEVERAVQGFEKLAKTSDWLGETGSLAEPANVSRAQEALVDGERVAPAALLDFVTDALACETAGKSPIQSKTGDITTLALPASFWKGLDDLPGFDQDSHTLRLTMDVNLVLDPQKRSVGFLGRAHPIVRRALDRVRNLQHGDTTQVLDRRVSVAHGTDHEPAVLFTFLGRLLSGGGRVREQVIAVRARRSGGSEVLLSPRDWVDLLAPARAEPTLGAWKNHFASWVPAIEQSAQDAARNVFGALMGGVRESYLAALDQEEHELSSWIASRAQDLCGSPLAAQPSLFADHAPISRWSTAAPPAERLASYHTDPSVPSTQRREAQGVVSLLHLRQADLARRRQIQPPDVSPLGLLLLLPAGNPS